MKIFVPTYVFDKVWNIDVNFLNKNGIRALILDVDNTLCEHLSPILHLKAQNWIKKMQAVNIKMLILSNSNDKNRIQNISKKLGVKFICNANKPLNSSFGKSLYFLNVSKYEVAIIGDQIFTDVMGGNLFGIKTILVTPFNVENKLSFKIRRFLENILLNRRGKK